MKTRGFWKRTLSLLLAASLWCGTGAVLSARAAEVEEISAEGQIVKAQTRADNFTRGTWTGADNQKVLQVIRAQMGRTGSSLGYTEEWCGNFVTDVARVAGVSRSIVPWDYSGRAYVPYLYTYMTRDMGIRTVSPQQALPGDIIMFSWDPPKNGAPGAYDLDHVAMVVWYDKDTDEITYIGGNQGSGGNLYKRNVSEVIMSAKSDSIAFILRPNYNTSDPSEPLRMMRVTTNITGDGTVTRQGGFVKGQVSSVTAVPGKSIFEGWYDKDGKLLTQEKTYSMTVTAHTMLEARFRNYYTMSAVCSRSGTVTGTGDYLRGDTAALTAVPNTGKTFAGWYDEEANLISEEPVLSWSAERDRKVYAIFDTDKFIDVPADVWYVDDVTEAANRGIVNGMTNITFGGGTAYTRAMAAEMLARLSGADTAAAPESSFLDTKNAWFTKSINWAAQNGVVKGRSATEFAPDAKITRQDFIVMAVRYVEEYKKIPLESKALGYSDAAQLNSDYAVEPAKKAQAMGLIQGDDQGRLRPRDTLNRAEATTILMRLVRFVDQWEQEHAPKPPEESETPGTPTGPESPETSEAPGGPEAPEPTGPPAPGTDAGAAA